MDQSRFTDQKTGSLVPIGIGDNQCAFVPDALPPKWPFNPELWPLLAEAKARLGTLNGIGRTLPNPTLLLRPIQDWESLRSSSLEGTFSTPQELLLYDRRRREPKSESDPSSDAQEVWNYGEALRAGTQLLKERPLSTVLINEMHKILLRGVRGRDKRPGQHRPDQVHVGSDLRYIPPPANLISDLMFDLQKYMNSKTSDLDPLVDSFIVHYQFEAIHPYIDGNGRVGRLLLSLMIMLASDHNLPWLYLSAYLERYKDEYVENMFRISAEGDWDTWIEFCLRGTIKQADDAIDRIQALLSLQKRYHSELDMNKPRIHRIVDDLFESPAVTRSELAKTLNVDYNTARADIDYLVKHGVLEEVVGGGKPYIYFCNDIFNIAYRPTTF